MDNRWDRKQQHLDRIGELARENLNAAEAGPFLEFMTRFFAGVTPEDLLDRRPESLFALALSLWRFAATRPPATAKVQVFNPSMEETGWHDRHTVVDVGNDDMPFLDESIAAVPAPFHHRRAGPPRARDHHAGAPGDDGGARRGRPAHAAGPGLCRVLHVSGDRPANLARGAEADRVRPLRGAGRRAHHLRGLA